MAYSQNLHELLDKAQNLLSQNREQPKNSYTRKLENILEDLCKQISPALQEKSQNESLNHLLRYQKPILQTLINSSIDQIYFKDRKGRFVMVNKAWANIWAEHIGSEPAKIIGKTDFDFFAPKVAKQAFADEQKVLETGNSLTDKEEMLQSKFSDRRLWVSCSKMPFYGEDGKVIGTFGISRDITSRKQIEETIKSIAHRMETIIETVGEGITLSDTEGYFEVFNSKMQEITGYTKQEVNGMQDFLARLYPNQTERHKAIEEINQLAQSTGYNEVETTICTKQGETRTLLVSSAIMEYDDKKHYLSAYRDITERKKAEQALRLSEKKLKETNATKDKFFSIIAHDLKNPFYLLKSFSKLLVENSDKLPEQKIQNVHQLMHQAALEGHSLLENLLEWSRSQTNRLKWNPEPIRLNELVKTNIKLFQGAAHSKKIQIKNQISPTITVFADSYMTNTVLRNLLSNAVKFTQNKGKITLSAENSPHENRVKICVSDTGIGIPPHEQKKLFRTDVSHSTHGTANERGSGLGLVLCKEFVEKNGGKIWVESKDNKGSDFFFTLPGKKPQN